MAAVPTLGARRAWASRSGAQNAVPLRWRGEQQLLPRIKSNAVPHGSAALREGCGPRSTAGLGGVVVYNGDDGLKYDLRLAPGVDVADFAPPGFGGCQREAEFRRRYTSELRPIFVGSIFASTAQDVTVVNIGTGALAVGGISFSTSGTPFSWKRLTPTTGKFGVQRQIQWLVLLLLATLLLTRRRRNGPLAARQCGPRLYFASQHLLC